MSSVFKGFPSMPKGEIVGIFLTGRQKVEYLFVIDGKLSSDGKIRSVNSISEFQIPGVGGVKEAMCKLHFGVSDTGSWRSQELRLFTTGVPKLRNVKRRNPETDRSEA
jgi:hypothetical protein